MLLNPLAHPEEDDRDDEMLEREARVQLAKSGPLQLTAELLAKLRSMDLSWWTPESFRHTWPVAVRMRWFKDRPDLRADLTHRLTGLAPNAARRFWPDDQAALIEAVLDTGDVSAEDFENAFDPCDLVVHGPAAEFWRQFRERMPWEEDAAAHQKLAAWLIRAMMTDRSGFEGVTRKPILSPWEIRSAIDPHTWQRLIPFEIRVAIDEARLRAERARPREPFHARHELTIATPERIVQCIPLTELAMIFTQAEKAMNYDGPVILENDMGGQSIEPPRPSQIN